MNFSPKISGIQYGIISDLQTRAYRVAVDSSTKNVTLCRYENIMALWDLVRQANFRAEAEPNGAKSNPSCDENYLTRLREVDGDDEAENEKWQKLAAMQSLVQEGLCDIAAYKRVISLRGF
eukprot:TRINITY_DN10482_c0_g2_i2.p1 TRINITY_DN10482_c0_g2~~TRINITY_DN10482_c0_g2_i2.p1  ORF type:complete len:121 (-),score=19.88 TRINITY_DN10482_c0_g2_i2:92-454(-)